MRDFILPLTLVVLLIAGFSYFFVGGKSAPTYQVSNRSIPNLNLELIDEAEKALESMNYKKSNQILDPIKDFDNVKIRVFLAEAKACQGEPISKEELGKLELEVSHDRDLIVVYHLALIYEAVKNQGKTKALLGQLSKTTYLPSELKGKVLRKLGNLLLNLGELKEAESVFSQAILVDPKFEPPIIDLVQASRRKKSYNNLDQIFALGNKFLPRKFLFFQEMGLLFWDAGKKTRACESFEKSLKIKPQSALAHYYLYANAQYGSDFERAFSELQKIINLNQPLPDSCRLPECFFQAFKDAFSQKKFSLSFQFLRQCILSDRSFIGRLDNSSLKGLEKALLQKGSPEENLFFGIFLSFIDGESSTALLEMKKNLGALKDPVLKLDGARLIEECLLIKKQEESYRLYQARIKELELAKKVGKKLPEPPKVNPDREVITKKSAHQTDPRIEEIKGFASNNSAKAEIQYESALQLSQLGDVDGATKLLNEAVRINPKYWEAYYSLGLVLEFERKLPEAIGMLEKSLQANPQNSTVRAKLALILLEIGENSRALPEARKAVESDPGNAEARYALARVYAKDKRVFEAQEEIKAGIECLRTENSSLQAKLTELKKQILEEQ